tara:strand:- start:18983 stop:19381 length:399 start_codon:yes stop_codon:yes gene_type:complete
MQIPINSHLAELFILLFLIITFGVSVIEKLMEWKGTISYIKETFKNTFVKSFIKPLVGFLLVLEVFSLLFLIIGVYQLFYFEEKTVALLGCVLSIISILYMLVGQRIAKDYPGATSLAVYFLICVFGVSLLN